LGGKQSVHFLVFMASINCPQIAEDQYFFPCYGLWKWCLWRAIGFTAEIVGHCSGTENRFF
jgi:hypothetical protein